MEMESNVPDVPDIKGHLKIIGQEKLVPILKAFEQAKSSIDKQTYQNEEEQKHASIAAGLFSAVIEELQTLIARENELHESVSKAVSEWSSNGVTKGDNTTNQLYNDIRSSLNDLLEKAGNVLEGVNDRAEREIYRGPTKNDDAAGEEEPEVRRKNSALLSDPTKERAPRRRQTRRDVDGLLDAVEVEKAKSFKVDGLKSAIDKFKYLIAVDEDEVFADVNSDAYKKSYQAVLIPLTNLLEAFLMHLLADVKVLNAFKIATDWRPGAGGSCAGGIKKLYTQLQRAEQNAAPNKSENDGGAATKDERAERALIQNVLGYYNK